jgi:glycogen phosphorylase
VHVDHVESAGVSDSPQIGETLHVRAYVSLGDLSPDEVVVQAVHGTARDSDELKDVVSEALDFVESYEGGRHQFAGDFALSRTGSFGYTVRILPRHEHLASTSELGLVANA